jgi:hypothetical protein
MLLLSKMRAKAAAFAGKVFKINRDVAVQPHGCRVSALSGVVVFFI